jgi:hypothetical protein
MIANVRRRAISRSKGSRIEGLKSDTGSGL